MEDLLEREADDGAHFDKGWMREMVERGLDERFLDLAEALNPKSLVHVGHQNLAVEVFSEGAGDALLVAERDPVSEGGCLGVAVLRGVGLAGELESRFEISLESKPGGGCTSCHGLCCGHCEER